MEVCTSVGMFSSPRNWSHFDHDADIGIHGWGRTLADAFAQAACAMTAVITDASIEPHTAVGIECEAPETEVLFVDWLNALVFEMATRQMLFSRFDVDLHDNAACQLTAQVWGETVDRDRHVPTVEVKGATLTELDVHQDQAGIWHARCILDV